MIKFNEKIQAKFADMCKTGKLFRVDLSGQQVWDIYLKSFSDENDPIFRDPKSTSKTCNLCNNFIRRYGNIVAIDKDNKIVTMFDVDADGEYKDTAIIMSAAIKAAKVTDVFFETFEELNKLPYESCKKSNAVFQLGTSKNVKRYNKEEAELYGVVKENEVRTFNHMHLFVTKDFVDTSGSSVESIMGGYRDAKTVFKRALDEISLDTLKLVRDLIKQGSLLNGETHLYKIEQILPLKEKYDDLPKGEKDNWCWVNSYKLPFAKFKNELIGVLCSELSEGEEINKACQSWNKRVDPVNYMKATAPITKKQIDEAKKFVEENGYTQSFDRRFATIDDIKVTEILHANVGKNEIKSVSIFDDIKPTSSRHKRSEFEKIEEVSIEKFMKDILPSCASVECFLGNEHSDNMVSLTTANIPDSKPIFKWSNNYSWTFNGNLAGKSEIKQAVKDAGGNVEGVLNFRLAWNDDKTADDNSDLDAWAQEPGNVRIGFSTQYRSSYRQRSPMSAQLDVDNTNPHGKMAVENITWTERGKMKDGVYKMWVNQYSARNSKGFKAEIEFGGETYCYEYDKKVTGNVQVAEVTLKDGQFSIKHLIPESAVSSKEIYGLESNQFHKVSLICLSPNHWGDNNVGNKHYMFMLEGCKSPVSIRSFHNENLIPELLEHRKVLEVLGATNSIPSTDKQLSGLGFNATVKDELVVKVTGTFKRMLKIKFSGVVIGKKVKQEEKVNNN
jgi:hypothetical protein